MKKLFVLTLALLMLLASCGAGDETTALPDESEGSSVNTPNENVDTSVDVKEPDVFDMKNADGLDALVGVTHNSTVTVSVLEDTYVEGGNSANKNFGASEMMDFKALNTEEPQKYEGYYRVPLLKFDISSLPKDGVLSVILSLDCFVLETPGYETEVLVYGCDPETWDEMSVTYSTRPQNGELVASAIVKGKGIVNIDVTDYVLNCIKYYDTEVSFALEGSAESMKRLNFSSKERGEGTSAFLSVTCGDYAYTTELAYDGENPWKLAMQNVSEWLEKWEIIKKGGDESAEQVVKIDAEYSLNVDACQVGQTDGVNTRYSAHKTRLISTLQNYIPDFSEVAKYDVYGGLMDEAMKQEATGYFYTKKIGDRWWNIDPLGYPFYRTAVVCVTAGDSGAQKQAVLAKYGDTQTWAQTATDRLKELGFNSTGNWSDIANLIEVENPLSQTQRWNIMSNYATAVGIKLPTPGNTTYAENVMPVFDPEFIKSAMASTKAQTEGYAGAPEVYGWFSDNELPCDLNTLDYSLKKDPKDPKWAHTYATAWTFMYMKTGKLDVTRADITDELRLEYRAMVYDKYFSVAKLCKDKYVPMHQYLGSRFTNGSFLDEYIVRVAGYYCDVVSLNYYGAWDAKATVIENLQKWSGKPFAVTEWYAKGMDVWEADNRMTNKGGAGFIVKTQADRGKFYQNFALSLLECKGCIGFDWFKYWDDDLVSSTSDHSNKGMLDNNGEEYAPLVNSMKELNTQKYNLIEFFDAR